MYPGNFANYRTFKFFNPQSIPASNFSFSESSKKLIYDAIAEEMKMRGYKSIQDADLMIRIQGGTMSSVEIRNNNWNSPMFNTMYGYPMYGPYYDFYNQPRSESKKESSIIIDFIDTKNDKVVWQGVGAGSFGKGKDIDDVILRSAITEIFAEYPYMAK